ncbi:MarR family winged helix-turn-helix transcriptional regulator [Microbacterium tenebrionis]|uniref:MarR family winged helix-turn-helix transcriptional regulator n=1 Tax=Microbacterium tenebrionis TaxID=2830665 RepID=UPI00202B589F|nr:MarR family transcriptional regulator [Microbacterium ihumii]
MSTPIDGRESLENQLSFLLARASAVSSAAGNSALAGYGLKVRSYSVLALACDPSRVSQREIAEYLRLDPSQVVALVDQLESSGLIIREPDARDRRANVIVATDAGHRLFETANAETISAEHRQHSMLTDAERDTLRGLLRKIAFPEA